MICYRNFATIVRRWKIHGYLQTFCLTFVKFPKPNKLLEVRSTSIHFSIHHFIQLRSRDAQVRGSRARARSARRPARRVRCPRPPASRARCPRPGGPRCRHTIHLAAFLSRCRPPALVPASWSATPVGRRRRVGPPRAGCGSCRRSRLRKPDETQAFA